MPPKTKEAMETGSIRPNALTEEDRSNSLGAFHLLGGRKIMTFTEAVRTCARKYVDFTGRATRSEFWYWMLFVFLVGIILQAIDVWVLGADFGSGILNLLFTLAVILPNLAAMARRLHDTDRTGWWLLIMLVPIIGVILLIVWWIRPGTEGENRFG